MRTQIISLNKMDFDTPEMVTTTFSKPKSLDEFDCNIVDLSFREIWENKGNSYTSVNCINDLSSIGEMITNRQTSTIVFVFPQNELFKYYWGSIAHQQSGYKNSVRLKDIVYEICNQVLCTIVPINLFPGMLLYENTRTQIGEHEYEADFYFQTSFYECVTRSIRSKKATTILDYENKVYATTLDLMGSYELLSYFINKVIDNEQKETTPEWLNAIHLFDDEEQIAVIQQEKSVIEKAKRNIKNAESILEKNHRYKSILYTNGEALVSVVFEILETIFSCDLSSFEDEKKEDFLIKEDQYTLIGEIKGVNTNAKRAHVSQLDNNYQDFMDNLGDDRDEHVYQVLIINPLRTKAPDEREPISENVIRVAERNHCLIVETKTLLSLFDKYKKGEIDTDTCVSLFLNNKGLLTLEEK